MRLRIASLVLSVALAATTLVGCASGPTYIANTEVVDTPENQKILETIEAYRLALEKRDASKLIMLASERYWEDAGTPSGADDFGYSRLKEILAQRVQQAADIRYSLRYKSIERRGDTAFVNVLVDASYTLVDVDGKPIRHDMRDRNQFVLALEGDDWKFVSGM